MVQSGYALQVFLLDSDLPENSDWDRTLTHYLYGRDAYYRLYQEAIFGIGGVYVLRAFGFRQVQRFNMNEGHSSLLVLELLDERLANHKRRSIDSEDIEAVRPQSIFASHTPVPAGRDQFHMDLAERVLGRWQDIIEDPEVSVNQTVSRTLQRKVGLYDTDLLPLVTKLSF